MDLQHRRRVVAQPVRHEARDVGDEHDPDRAVHADVDVQVEDHDRRGRARGPGNTIGSDAMLSSSQRPGSLVFTTIQQMTDVTSITIVAVPNESSRLFHTVRAEVRVGEDEAVRVERQVLQRLHRRHRIEPLERRPQQHGERQHDDQQEVDDEDRRREPAPARRDRSAAAGSPCRSSWRTSIPRLDSRDTK